MTIVGNAFTWILCGKITDSLDCIVERGIGKWTRKHCGKF